MYICKDLSQRFLLAVYWEDRQLLVVIKELLPNRDLVEHAALSYTAAAAEELMESLRRGANDLSGVHIDALTATAIAGRIAEGLRTSKLQVGRSRLRPELWQ